MTTTPRDRVTVECQVCGSDFEVTRSREHKAVACSRPCADVLRERTAGVDHPLRKAKVSMACELCGAVCEVKPSLVSRFRFCSRACTGAWVSRNQPRISKPEQWVGERLVAAGFDVESQAKVGRYVPDFRLGNVLVEVDGTYWHSLPEIIARDQRKNAEYLRRGHCIVRIPESFVRERRAA